MAKAISTEMNYRQMIYYSLTGEQFDGKRSVEIGFTTMSVPRAELEAKTLAVATVLKGKDRHALRATKDAFKAVDIRSMSYEDARSWLKARLTQMTLSRRTPTGSITASASSSRANMLLARAPRQRLRSAAKRPAFRTIYKRTRWD